jgi:hypothetical protein
MVHDRLILSIGLRHMGYVLRREIRDALRAMPDDLLSPAETLVIFEIADDANDATRRTMRGSDDLAWLLRMTSAAFRKHVQRIEAKGIKLRIEVGLDSTGRATYAHKGIQTNYLIPRLSTGTPKGGQSVHPKSQRVDNLSTLTEPKGGQSVQQRVDNLSTPSPQIPSIKTSSSGASYRDRVAALTGADDDGIDLVIDRIKSSTKKPVRNLGALIRSISDQDIVDHHASLAPAPLPAVVPTAARRCPVHPGTTSWPCASCAGDVKAGEDPFQGREDERPDGWFEAHPLAARLLDRSAEPVSEPDVWVSPMFDAESGGWVAEDNAGGDSLESTACTNSMCQDGYIYLGASGRRPCRVCGGPVTAGKPASVADVLGSFANSFGGM